MATKNITDFTELTTPADGDLLYIMDDPGGTEVSKKITRSNLLSGLTHGTEVDNPSSGVHGATGTIVGTSDTQTLTNKTIDADNNTVSNLAHGAEVDNPTSGVHGVTGSVVGTSDSQTLTNKTLGDDLGMGGNNITNLSYVDINEISEPSSGTNTARLFAFDQNGETRLKFIDPDGLVIDITQDNNFVVRNNTGSAMSKGDVVYVSSQTGVVPDIALAKADSTSTMPAVAILNEDISDTSFGTAMKVGVLENIDTSSFSANDVLYVSETTAGQLTNTRPPHPHINQQVGRVLVSSAGSGSIKVNIEQVQGNELGTSQNVFRVGDNTAGAKILRFRNSSDGDLSWNPTAGRTLTLPDATDTLVGKATTDTLTNKTIDADNNTVSNLAHGAEVDNPSSGVHGVTGSVVGTSDTQTLTNKTINGATLSGVLDAGGATSFEIPNGGTPTVNAAGEVAVDTSITDYTGLIKYHDGTEELSVVAMPTANLSTTDGDVVAYNATNDEFEMVAQSGGGGGSTDGWTDATSETWSYASATSFTVSGDLTTQYQKGTKIKMTQSTGGTKYFVVKSSSYSDPNTTVNIVEHDGADIQNEAISDNYYSYESGPQGFPTVFLFTTSYTGFSSDPSGKVEYTIDNGFMFGTLYSGQGTSNDAAFNFTLPIAPNYNTSNFRAFPCSVQDGNSWQSGNGVVGFSDGSTTAKVGIDGSTISGNSYGGFTSSGGKSAIVFWNYPI